MITMALDNPKLDLDVLRNIENKIRENREDVEDLKLLNHFISSVDKDYINLKMKENNIHSFEEYISERKKPYSQQNPNLSIFVGNLLAIISFLKTSLT